MLTLSIFSRHALAALSRPAARYASTVPSILRAERPKPPPGTLQGPLRPHLNVEVNPNHGLYGFFRRRTDKNSWRKPKGTDPEYVAWEVPLDVNSGRSWSALELRRKSFKDLHTLWYVLLRERNLLNTQSADLNRIEVAEITSIKQLRKLCQISMARIKHVLSERKNAYMKAAHMRRILVWNPERLGELVPMKKDIIETKVKTLLRKRVLRKKRAVTVGRTLPRTRKASQARKVVKESITE
ncbi:hypothetical protein M422DRAFT_24650, partial [Sphaerobolus stellatus SS14]